jgi:hypothetical protein
VDAGCALPHPSKSETKNLYSNTPNVKFNALQKDLRPIRLLLQRKNSFQLVEPMRFFNGIEFRARLAPDIKPPMCAERQTHNPRCSGLSESKGRP